MYHLLLASALLLPASGDFRDPSDLDAVMAELRGEIQNHQWLRILDRSDPQHREAQTLQNRQAHAEYVRELLGIETGAAPASTVVRLRDIRFRDLLPSKLDERLPASAHSCRREATQADLDQIRRVTWTGVSTTSIPGRRAVHGIATMRSGRKLRLEATLVKRPSGWMLTGG
jgi:hypothetical protein